MLKTIATNPEFRKGLLKIEDLNHSYANSTFKLSMDEVSQEVHALLVTITTDTTWTLVDAIDANGLEAWRVSHAEYFVVTFDGKRRVLSKVIQPKQVQKSSGILQAQAEWESHKSSYEELTRKTIDEELLITGYMGMLPDKIREAAHGLEKEIEKLSDL